MKTFVTILLIFLAVQGYAQLPNASFTLDADLCRDENLQITNTSTNGVTFDWDFCEGDLSSDPTAEIISFLGSSFAPKDIDVIYDGSGYYALVVVRSSNELYRFTFGNFIWNTSPVVENLGDLNGALRNPEQIELVRSGNQFFAFVLNAADLTLQRLDFGTDLGNIPAVEQVYTGLGAFNAGMEVNKSDDGWTVFFTNFGNQIQVLPVGSNISTIPPSNSDYTLPPISSAIGLSAITIVKRDGEWIGFTSALNSRSVYRIEFGVSVLNTTPVITRLSDSSIGSDRPSILQVVQDAGSEILSIQLLGGSILQWELGEDITNDVQNVTMLAAPENAFTMVSSVLVKQESRWVSLAINQSKRYILSMAFPNDCDSTPEVSSEFEPVGIHYKNEGDRFIGLVVADATGNLDYTAREVRVSNVNSPSPEFIVEGACVDAPLRFLALDSLNITSYEWDFGDGSMSADKNPSYQYVSAGTYIARVVVGTSNGCDNSMAMTINVSDSPVAGYVSPGSLICTNQQIYFENTSVVDPEFATYEWSVEGEIVSVQEDLIFEFPSSGSFQVSLTTSIPGCTDTFITTINVLEGADPSFTFTSECANAPVTFTNTSQGQVSSFLWEFGDGTTSVEESPIHTYANSGTFNVVLSLTNANGCVVFEEQQIVIHALPVAAFINELECTDLPVRFIDESSVEMANITEWHWDFGEAGASEDQNPSIVFDDQGNYTVELIVTSEFLCRDTTKTDIVVRESPMAAFTNSSICPDEPIQFFDESTPATGTTISSWAWDLDGTFSDSQNPVQSFEAPGMYDISLTVVASDQCFGTVSASILVPEPLVVDFIDQNSCTGKEATFIDVTSAGSQEIVERRWDFGGIGSSTDSVATFTFSSPGSYTVGLTVVTRQGCEYSGSRVIDITEEPQSSFTASTLSGPPPLSVRFENTSPDSDSLVWLVNDVDAGSGDVLDYVFQEEGVYTVSLRVFSTGGCFGETSVQVTVSDPEMDLAINAIRRDGQDILIEVENLGNIRTNTLPLEINYADSRESRTIDVPLQPGTSDVIRVSNVANGAQDICTTIEPVIEGYSDLDLSNNSACILIEGSLSISAPYPNPASDRVTLNVYSEGETNADFEWVAADGRQLYTPPVPFNTGFGEYTFDTTGLAPGVYYLKVEIENDSAIFRIVIE